MKALRHWMLHNDTLAQEFDAILKLSPGYNPVRLIDPAVSFFASLLTNVNDVRGKVGNFARASTGVYRASDGTLAEAVADVSRHEWQAGAPIGLLMEPASTNTCLNYNANPDANLENMEKSGGAGLVMQRTADAFGLNQAGLDRICSDGNVIELDNRTEPGNGFALVYGGTGNLNNVVTSVYVRGTGQAEVGLNGAVDDTMRDLPAQYTRWTREQTPDSTNRIWRLQVGPNSRAFFVLNQLEEQQIVTSPIVTKGAAGARDVDILNWSIDSLINNAEGMAALIWIPGWSSTDWQAGSIRPGRIVNFNQVQERWIFPQIEANSQTFLQVFTGTGGALVSLPDNAVVAHTTYLIGLRWSISANQIQIGRKIAGNWVWGNTEAFSGYTQAMSVLALKVWESSIKSPETMRDFTIWTEDRGTAWLEDYYSGVAN